MAACVSQLIVALSVLFAIAGSSHVFRAVGDSVQLDINGSVSEFDDFSWVFKRTDNVLKYYKKYKDILLAPRYKDRVEFNEETCSLTLKNLQKTDDGLYEVKTSSAEKTTVTEYQLSVVDPVEAPVLTHKHSTGPCNITLTCRGHDLSINSSCNNETCEEKEVTSPGGVALSLSVRDSTIICNHSNTVSWKRDAVEMKTFGQLCADEEPRTAHSKSYWPVYVILTAVILLILAVVLRKILQRRPAGSDQGENTIYATVENNNPPSSLEMTLETPSTVYSVVANKHQHPSNGESRHNTETKEPVPASVTGERSTPESIYSIVTKPSKAE